MIGKSEEIKCAALNIFLFKPETILPNPQDQSIYRVDREMWQQRQPPYIALHTEPDCFLKYNVITVKLYHCKMYLGLPFPKRQGLACMWTAD